MNARQYYAQVRRDRETWRAEMVQRCMNCGKRFGDARWSEIHEIEKRSQAPKSWAQRCNYLLLCNPCHWAMDNEEWTHARQLSLKALRDPENFDLAAWLAIKPRPATYVTEDEVRRAS